MRRTGGLLLLGLVVLLAVVLPGVIGRPVGGTPQAAVIPAPFGIGDCIGAEDGDPADRGPWPASFTRVDCAGDHFGEVVEVALDGGSLARQSSLGITEPDVGACRGPAVRYLGQASPVLADPDLARWDPVPAGSIGIAGPTAFQRSAGQTWVACLISSAQPYRGSAAGAFSAERVLPAELGTCLADPDAVRYPVLPCTDPHRTEILATTSLDDADLLGDRLTGSCTRLAEAVTGRALGRPADLGAAALVVHFEDGSATAGLPAAAPVRGWAACVVSAGRALVGSTIGIGEDALPWAG
ncbi:septum formation family protein [Nakamurella flavida]|uniref:Septum formation family protein n=1 Tax=Nakamurella flavida TaxID=363630 RepID=A0A938YBW8_9ACTN|nr:septum formation family protein [Nakamurella flavida]MBM9474831.1 septum formation family protein [Nakamurella flavida]MDP9776401.1 hypothetical protein [Nakamurella flavida]